MAGLVKRRVSDPTTRFWAKVDRSGDCWLWQGATVPRGYGKFQRGRRGDGFAIAHRVAYEMTIGPIPEGMHIDHLCRTPACVRPSHLEAVTPEENRRRQAASVTHCPQGHPYDEANTIRWRNHRQCRTCVRARERARKRVRVR